MNKPLVLSLVTAALLSTTALSADTMYDRFQQMELQMKQMKQELNTLKAQKATSAKATDEEADDNADAEESDGKEDVKSTATNDEEADDEGGDDEESVDEKIADLQENVAELNKNTNSNHLKFNVDYRFAIENLDYKLANGKTAKNNAFMTNRFWMNMSWAATKNLSFHGQLAYNKAFGARSGINARNGSMENFDWIANENAYNDTVRIKNVYFLYKNSTFAGIDMPWTFSIGRRPSTNGHLINFRDDDHPSSPMGHSINVEFDGLSAKFGLENITGVNGMYIKFCAGRGLSNAAPKFSYTPYANVNSSQGANPDIDLAGFIFVPYSDGQYTVNTQYYYANNLIDSNTTYTGFDTVGGLHSITANFIANGIGDGISDFLDDTIFFVSGAMSITNPNKDQGMLGSKKGESKTGYSYWVGTQFPSLISEEGRWGLEYNHGSQYWRSITYAEDTNIGSKVAARGDAYEAYFTEPLIEDILSMQIRYTYIDYKYAGSNGFFGNTSGNAMKIAPSMIVNGNDIAENVVDKAQDIRFYIRYRY